MLNKIAFGYVTEECIFFFSLNNNLLLAYYALNNFLNNSTVIKYMHKKKFSLFLIR